MTAVKPFRSYVVVTDSPGGAKTILARALLLGLQCEETGGASFVTPGASRLLRVVYSTHSQYSSSLRVYRMIDDSEASVPSALRTNRLKFARPLPKV